MSSQFNYELDERQIRMMMQGAESEYNESMWQKFDDFAKINSKQGIEIGNYFPKFNLSISRSIVVPVLFIILIGGLSAMLFSFVDFKKKEAIEKEIPLVANPENVKKPEIAVKKITPPVEKKKVEVVPTPTVNEIATTTVNTSPEIKKAEPEIIAKEKAKETIVAASTPETKKETILAPPVKKKKRKLKEEVLPTINVTTNLNEGASNEPELDLR